MAFDLSKLSLVALVASDMSYKGNKTSEGETLHTYQDSPPTGEWQFPSLLLSGIQKPYPYGLTEPLLEWDQVEKGRSNFPEYELSNWQVVTRLDGKLNGKSDGFGATIFSSRVPDSDGRFKIIVACEGSSGWVLAGPGDDDIEGARSEDCVDGASGREIVLSAGGTETLIGRLDGDWMGGDVGNDQLSSSALKRLYCSSANSAMRAGTQVSLMRTHPPYDPRRIRGSWLSSSW